MDKSTIRVYGWIVIAVIVASVIISSMAMFADDVLQSLHILPENIENRYESGLPAGAVGSLNTPENLNLSEDYIFSFDAVPGADRYVVTIESNGVTTLKTTSSTFVDCAVELDTIKSYATIAVKAVSSSPDVKDSETAVYFIIRTLGVTSNIQLDSDYLLTFNAVDFANRYTIKIDGVTVCTTDTTSVSLAEYLSDKKGSVDISVIADDATGKYFSGEEAKLRVTLTYTVQYISNGSTIKTEYVKVALPHSHASFNLHSLSDTDDQAFRGWENEGETYEGGSYVTITSDVTYTAKWVNIYTIEFKVNGETISEIITEGDVEIPTYTPDENHEFDGWKAGGTIYVPGKHVQFTEDTILDAVLVPIYDVTVKYNDGTTSDTSYTTRGSVTLPATPTRSGYYFLGWSDGVSTYQAGNVHVISKDTTYTAVWGKICSIPSVGGSLVYNGGVQSPNWLNLDASAITVGGQTSATNAGVYVTTFTPNSGFVWNDGTATTKSISWEIAKANGSVTLSATSGTITYPGEGNFTAAGTGTLSVESSDTAIATANVADGKITVVPGTTAGTATITVTSAATTNYKAATATYTVTVKLGTLNVTANGYSGTYDGSAHSISVSCSGATIKYGTASGSYTLTTNPTYKNAGTYTVYYQVSKPGYTTVTGSKTVVINKAALAVPKQSGSLTYTGSAQSPAWDANYDSGKMTLGGTTSGTNAGTYTATFTLKDAANYQWSDGTTAAKSVTWTIGKKTVSLTVPAQSGSLTYTGSAQSPTWNANYDSGKMTLGATTSGTNAGSYTATFTLKTATNYTYKWSDGTTAAKSVTWTIGKKTVSLTVPAQSGSLTYTGSAQSPAWNANYDSGKMTLGGTTSGTNAGSYTAKFTLKTATNYTYKWSDGTTAAKSVTWTIGKKSNTLKLSATSGTVNYNGTGTFTVSTNTSGGALSVTSSNTTVCAVSISGTTITLTGKQAGTATITVTSAATTNYKAATATYTVTVNKIANTLSLSATSGTITYPNQGSFSVTSNTSGGALSVKSSNTAIATVSISNGKVTIVPGTTAGTATITVTSAATTNYKTATATYKVTVKLGSLPPLVSASGYFGTYDGSPHGITVTCDGATIKYGTTEGEYPLTNSPTFTDVPTDGTGRYVVYFQVSKPGYETYTSSLPVVISRAPIAVKPSQHGTLLYNGTRLTPAWDNFNSSQLTIGGVTSAIDAGTYRASFTPTSNYKWSDGSTGSYSVFWTIDSEPAPGWYFPEQWEALWRGESVAPEYPWDWLNGDYLFVDNGTTYGDTDYIGGDLEDGMLVFPSDGTVTCIGAYGFANLGNLCGVYIPSTITTIEEFAFDFCENIYDFRIAKGLKYLEGPLITCGGATIVDEITYYGTIADWRSIAKDPTWTKGLWKTDIVCTDGNVLKPGLYVDGEYVETWDHLEQRSWVTLTNSVLTGVDFSYYDAYSENVHLVMDDSVTAISNSAFSQNSCITGITISNRVTELQSFVFGRCASLKTIVIPDSVTVLGNAVFDDTSLESIIYKGTIQDWKNIDMGIWWESNYDLPIDRITCLDGYIYRVKFLSGYSTTATYWLENGEKVPYVEVDNDAIDSSYWFSFDSWFYGTTEYIGDADMTYLISVTTDKNGNAVESNLIVNQPITLTAATYKIVNIIAKDIKNSEYICDQIVLPSSNLTGTLPSEVNVEGWLVTGFYRTNSSGTKVNYSLGGNFTLSSTDSATVDIYCNQRSTRVMIAWYFHIYESYNSTTYKTKDGPYYEYIDPSVTPYLYQSNWGKKYSELNPNMSIDYEKMYTKKPTAYKYGQQQSFTSKTGATSTSWLDGYYLDLSKHKGAYIEMYVHVYPRFQHFNLVLNDDDTNTNTYYTFKLNYGAETFSFQDQLYDGTVPADIFDGFCVTTAWYPNPSNSHTSGIAPSTTFSSTYNIEPGVTNYMLIEGYWERSGMYVPGTGTQIMSWSEMKNMGLVLDSKLSTLLFDLGDLHFLPITEWWDALMNDKSIINMDFKFDADAAFAGSKNTLYGFLKYCEDNGITRNGYKITTDLMFDLYIPEDSNLKTVAPWACAFTNAKAVYLPSTVTNIGDGAFTHCYFLNQLTLPSGLVNLGKGAFSFSQLERVEIPAGVKTIPNDAFSGCTSLEYVTFLGNNVMSIGDRAFMYCESLKTITTKTTANALPSSLETIGAQAFCLCQNMTKLTIPARVTTIGMYAFALWDMPDYFTPFGVQIGTADGAFCGITIKDNYAGAGKGTTIRFEGVPIWGFPLGMMAFNTATIETAATILDWTAFMSWKTVIPWADYRGTSVVCSNGKFPIKYFI